MIPLTKTVWDEIIYKGKIIYYNLGKNLSDSRIHIDILIDEVRKVVPSVTQRRVSLRA